MVKIEKYHSAYKDLWDNFILNAKNSHFMFYRDYMEYHSNKFKDNSLIFMNDKGQIISLLPANIENNVLYTHQGLTFGGIISSMNMKTSLI